MSKAFVTGVAGFLGNNVIRELLYQGWDVTAFHLPTDNLKNLSVLKNIKLVEGDILDYQSLLNAIPRDEDVIIFHIAGDTSMWDRNADRQFMINVTGTANVAKAALERGVGKLVFTSSISAYGYHSDRIDEETPSNALTCKMNYNKTKYLAELEIKKAIEKGLNAVILNPCNMMGPFDMKGWSTLIMSVLNNDVPAVTLGVGTFAHVSDVARAHIKAAEVGRKGENYLIGGVEILFRDIYREITEMLGKKMNLRTVSSPVFRIAMYLIRLKSFFKKEEPILTYPRFKRLTGRIICNDKKARKELSFQTCGIKEMLSDSYAWLQDEGLTIKENS